MNHFIKSGAAARDKLRNLETTRLRALRQNKPIHASFDLLIECPVELTLTM